MYINRLYKIYLSGQSYFTVLRVKGLVTAQCYIPISYHSYNFCSRIHKSITLFDTGVGTWKILHKNGSARANYIYK